MKTFENISLKPFNTFGIDVKARRMLLIEPGDDIPTLEGDVLLLGAGSNMVFTKDYDGTVVILSHSSNQTIRQSDNLVTVWGGIVMDDLVQWTLNNNLFGLENLSAIPGTVGASAVQNVGAYGAEAKDFIESVEAFDLQQRRHCTFTNADCRFAYRDSLFKHHPGRYLILRVSYRLSHTFLPNLSYKALEELPHASATQLREAITQLRWSKLPRPEEFGSAGSFFKNPVVDDETYLRLKTEYPDIPQAHRTPNGYKLSAGWLIDRAGWKGRTQGGAGVWPMNALVLYNASHCSGNDVVALAEAIQHHVQQKFGVLLLPEAIIIGKRLGIERF